VSHLFFIKLFTKKIDKKISYQVKLLHQVRMEFEFVKHLLTNHVFSEEMVINIFLVLKGARKSTLLEYANVKNTISHYNFLNSILTIINIFNSICDQKLAIYLENEKPYQRYLVYKSQDFHTITQSLNKQDHDFELGKFLEMTFPGGNFYDFNQPRFTGLIQINDISLFAETFVVQDYKHEYRCLRNNLEYKIKKWNIILREIGLECYYTIMYDDGFEYRKMKYEKKDFEYIRDHIDEYMNDRYNELI
jgi:hypothetical protein